MSKVQLKAYLKFIHREVKVLTYKDKSQDQNVRVYTSYLKNLWREVQSGVKTVNEAQKSARESLHTFFPNVFYEDTIPTIENYHSLNVIPHPYDREKNEKEQGYRNSILPQPEHPALPSNAVTGTPYNQKERTYIGSGAANQSLKCDNLRDTNCLGGAAIQEEEQLFNFKGSSGSKGDQILSERSDSNTTKVLRGDESRESTGEENKRKTGRHYNDVFDSQQQYLLDINVSQSILKKITLRNSVEHYRECLIPCIQRAVLIRVTGLLQSLSNMAQFRRQQRIFSTNSNHSRSVVLVSMEREQEEAHLRREMQDRVSKPDFDKKRKGKVKDEVQLNLWSGRIRKNQARKNKPSKAVLRMRAERNNELLSRRRMIMSEIVQNRERKQSRSTKRELQPMNEPMNSFDEEKKFRLTETEKLAHLPSLVSRAHLEKQIEVSKPPSTPRAIQKRNCTVTLVDCNRIMEYDSQLRKSELRYRWMSRM